MGERAGDAPRYTAFLSYSHIDSAPAGRLHRRLETYRMPKRLVGTETARGPVPERLAPIFRDRDELPAATDLSETVREALAQSGALIILCSPHAAESLWVAEEIKTFRRLHPGRPILAAVLDGDPPACFPAALRAFGKDGTWHEPLATDLRTERDGAHLGLLKLVAGITGVGLDTLVQRDAARRIRRVTAGTIGALIATLIMAALALVAVDARREAERQRAGAEGLIEFMLTDLRTRLEGVGRIEIMAAVNRRALAYYGRQELDDLSPDSLERRARVLHAMGQDEADRGNLRAALAAYLEASRTTEEQLARAPNDPERIFAHSQSEYYVGSIDQLRGNYVSALAAYRRYHAQAERLNALVRGNPRYLGELAYAENNLGSLYLNGFQRPGVARRHFRNSLPLFLQLTRLDPRNPAWAVEAAEVHGWLADTWFNEGRFVEARSERLIEHRMKRAMLAGDPSNRAYLYATVVSIRSLARIDIELRAFGRARELLRQAQSAMAALLALDADNIAWRDQAAMVAMDQAKLSIAAGLPGEAGGALARARALIDGSRRRGAGPTGDREYLATRMALLVTQIRAAFNR